MFPVLPLNLAQFLSVGFPTYISFLKDIAQVFKFSNLGTTIYSYWQLFTAIHN